MFGGKKHLRALNSFLSALWRLWGVREAALLASPVQLRTQSCAEGCWDLLVMSPIISPPHGHRCSSLHSWGSDSGSDPRPAFHTAVPFTALQSESPHHPLLRLLLTSVHGLSSWPVSPRTMYQCLGEPSCCSPTFRLLRSLFPCLSESLDTCVLCLWSLLS